VDESRMARQLLWWKDANADQLRRKIDHVMLKDSKAPSRLLRIFTPTLYVSTDGEKARAIKANFEAEQYHLLDHVIGADLIYDKLKKKYRPLSNFDFHTRPE
jgi:hypothetical protein